MNLPDLFRESSLWGHDPLRRAGLQTLQKEMDRFLQSFPTPFATGGAWAQDSSFLPSCDVEEAGDHYVLSMDLPGVRKEDIKVELNENLLTISGERKEEKEESKKGYYRSERSFGSFARSFSLPESVKAEQIASDFRNGVLRIAIPKTSESERHEIRIGESKHGFFDRLLGHDKKEGKKPDKAA